MGKFNLKIYLKKVVAIDGITICQLHKNKRRASVLHVLSSYASEFRLCNGQELVDKKTNLLTI